MSGVGNKRRGTDDSQTTTYPNETGDEVMRGRGVKRGEVRGGGRGRNVGTGRYVKKGPTPPTSISSLAATERHFWLHS